MNFINIPKLENSAEFVASSILKKLEEGNKVLFFATGGSSVLVGAGISEILRAHSLKNLTVTLTDERYGPPGHSDSNFAKLISKGFNFPQARIIPVLTGDDFASTAKNFNEVLKEELSFADYKIGLFGVGADGHTAGILPESPAVYSEEYACGYETPAFSRITMTPRAIEKLDEAVVFARGEEKREALEDLQKSIDIAKQPAQILKKVPLLTIFYSK